VPSATLAKSKSASNGPGIVEELPVMSPGSVESLSVWEACEMSGSVPGGELSRPELLMLSGKVWGSGPPIEVGRSVAKSGGGAAIPARAHAAIVLRWGNRLMEEDWRSFSAGKVIVRP
jgi:hypothetical protein